MPRTLIVTVAAWNMAVAFCLAMNGEATAQTVWTGFAHTFTKPLFGDPSAAENQDRITENVWLTRGNNRGLFNIQKEMGYSDLSPADTEWATDLIAANAGKEIKATNWANLAFDNWVDAYDGGQMQLPGNLTSNNAVLHLITDNIYLDIQFTDWSIGAGSFSYDRAVGTVTPPSATGDYNENGFVDAADYVLWRDTLNQTVTPAGGGADGNMSGTVDAADYDFWRARFGNMAPIPGAGAGAVSTFASAIPEPGLAPLLIAGLLALFRRDMRIQHLAAKQARGCL